jgi:iron complex transport system ATP-binding protein
MSALPAEPMHARSVLRTSGLAVGWNGRIVLRDIDLAIEPGERVALLGSNGSGKTTLLRVLAGIAPPLAGELTWRGAALPKGGARCRVVGYVLQTEPTVHFTVRQLVALGLGTDGPPSAPQMAEVARVLADEGLTELADRRCSTLSGGEWQRAVIARALVAQPALLLLDEPTSHLDPARRAVLHERLLRLRDQAVVLATHDLELAALCDRVMILGDGRAMAVGGPREVLTAEVLEPALGVRVRRLDDPEGGPSLFRVVGLAASFAAPGGP